MDSYIDEQRHQGELDSEGSFTVDPVAALRITLASALPEPHYYLFQIAQGLVAAGATEIEVAIGRDSSRFRFQDPKNVFKDLGAARERLFKGLTLSSDRPLDLVLTGMATAVGSEMDRAVLSGPAAMEGLSITLDQAAVVSLPGARLARTSKIDLHRQSNMGLSFAWTRIWGGRVEEGDLQKRFEYSSPPLRIGGLPTSPGLGWRHLLPATSEVLLEAVLPAEHGAPPNHRAPLLVSGGAPSRLIRTAFTENGEVILDDEGASVDWERRRWTVYLTSDGGRPATLVWIRYGMVVETATAELDLGGVLGGGAADSAGAGSGPGLVILAPAEGLDVDASGYSLVKNDRYHARLLQAQTLVRDSVVSVRRDSVVEALREVGRQEETDSFLQAFPWL